MTKNSYEIKKILLDTRIKVLTNASDPPPFLKMSEIKIISNFWFKLDPPSPICKMSLNHLFYFSEVTPKQNFD